MSYYYFRCFKEGQSSVERVIHNLKSIIGESSDSNIFQILMSVAIGFLPKYLGGVSTNGMDIDNFNQFAVRPEDLEKRQLERKHRIEKKNNSKTLFA